MKKNDNNKDFKPWQESFLGAIGVLGLIIFLIIKYDLVKNETSGTKGKVLQNFLQYLDVNFGKEYVFGFLILVMVLFGISSLRSYLKHKNNNTKT